MGTSASSINFVITAIYAGTFANSLYQLFMFNDKIVEIQSRPCTTLAIVLCALICMTMTVRFFFGNNNFMDHLFEKSELQTQSATSRLYHFLTVVSQSLILLASSYLIRNPVKFLLWMAILFAAETIWYAGCLLFVRDAISDDIGRLNKPLAVNEVANVLTAVAASAGYTLLFEDQDTNIYVVAAIFAVNTAIDLRVNLKSYMGIT